MPEGVSAFVEDGFATIDFTDRSKRAEGLAALLKNTPAGLVQTVTRSGPRRQYRVPEGNAREAGLLDSAESQSNKAVAWHVTITATGGTYTLSVDGVATTALTPASTPAQIEDALNETSGPVGLDVAGTSTDYEISTQTPAVLTINAGSLTGGTGTLNTTDTRGVDSGFAQALDDADPYAEADQSWHHPVKTVADSAYGSGVGTVTGPLRPNKAVDADVPPVPDDAAELHADLQARVRAASTSAANPSSAGDPSEDWTVDKLRAHARDNGINLEGATRKDDILDKIRAG